MNPFLAWSSDHGVLRPGPLMLMRHGQTEWNLVGRRQGQLDSPLTPAGVENARRLTTAIAGSGIDRIFSSPQGRARRTAEIVGGALHLDVHVLSDLAEVDHGAMAGLTDHEIAADFPDQWRLRSLDKYRWRFPGGESYADAEQRAVAALRTISAAGAALPLVVTHAMLGRLLRRHLLRLPVDAALALEHPNDVAYLIEEGTSTSLRPG